MYSENTIHLLSCTDKNYLQQLCVLITSLFENKTCTNNFVYHVFHDDLKLTDIEELLKIAQKYNSEVELHDMNTFHLYDSIIRYGHVSKAALYRLSVADILPIDVKKVLYLDCDMVINGDIFNLWNTNIDNYQVAAVEDAPLFTRHAKLFMPPDSRYFNSGVLLINLEKWRTNNTALKIIEFLVKFPERRTYNDQDGLNAVLHSEWLRLPPVYNQQTVLFFLPAKRLVYSKSENKIARKFPIIVHYTGVNINTKPWQYIDSHPFKRLYFKYLKLTKWSEFKPKCKGISDIFKKYYYIALRFKMKSGFVFSKLFKNGKN